MKNNNLKNKIFLGLTKEIKKKNSFFSIIKFSIFKIKSSFIIWILLFLSLIMFSIMTLIFFLNKINIIKIFINFNYGVLIFINIFLILFILLIIIKIFSKEFDDGTYLLLLSKPFSRTTIFILKLISIWIMIFLFIGINILFLFIFSIIGNFFFENINLIKIYNYLILKLFLFSLKISFFSSSGILFISSFLKSQTVLLIGILFCSLFLLGGMPYSLLMKISNNITLNFENVIQKYSIQNIKNIFLFDKNLKENNIKYNNIIKKIYNFYMQMSLNEINLIRKNEDDYNLKIKRLNFYEKELDLIERNKNFIFFGNNIKKWEGYYNNKNINKIIEENYENNELNENEKKTNIEINLFNDYFFKTYDKLSNKNIYHSEIIDLIKYYKNIINFNIYYNLRKYNFTSLFLLNYDKSFFNIFNNKEINNIEDKEDFLMNSDNKFSKNDNNDPINIYIYFLHQNENQNLQNFLINDKKFIKEFKNYFQNNVLFILQELESNIIQKVFDYKLINNIKIIKNLNFKKYNDLSNLYNIIVKFNIIEHWNQIWSNSLNFLPFYFVPLELSNIDFEEQKNLLISYQDLFINFDLDKNKIDYNFFINIKFYERIYIIFSFLFLFLTWFILERKNIL